MRVPTPVVELKPRVRAALEEACFAVFKTAATPALAGPHGRDFALGFVAHYQRLIGLPRRTRRSIERRWKHTLSAIALLMSLGAVPASAAVIQVSPDAPPAINADGECSLIEAIVNANRNARRHLDCVAGSGAVDTIVLPPFSPQVLNAVQMLPTITSSIVIEGQRSTISRNARTSLAFLNVGASGDLTLNETVVTGALAGGGSGGRGIVNRGRLALNDSSLTHHFYHGLANVGGVAVLNDSSVTDNLGAYGIGCGIHNSDGGRLRVTNSVISGNCGYFSGSAIYNANGSSAVLTYSSVSQNKMQYGYQEPGGGIMNRGALTLMGTTVSGNKDATNGGGIYNASTGNATVRRSTISNNHAYYRDADQTRGGGIDNRGRLTLVNSTVSNNEVVSDGQASGGGVSSRGTLTIISSTVTGNVTKTPGSDFRQGGGVSVETGTLTLQRSIVSGNTATTGREVGVDAGVSVTVNNFNLFGHDGEAGVAGFTPGSTDIVPNKPVDGILLPLADNGGGTRTHALAMASPALDASPDDADCPTVDQRGSPRPRGAACDIGSFEGSAVLCNGKVTTMVGTDGPDEMTGTLEVDVIAGLTGDDVISGLAGEDIVCAGGGADHVLGGSGNDVLFGQGGNDRLFGNQGRDRMDGGAGRDRCDGGLGIEDSATACETVSDVP